MILSFDLAVCQRLKMICGGGHKVKCSRENSFKVELHSL